MQSCRQPCRTAQRCWNTPECICSNPSQSPALKYTSSCTDHLLATAQAALQALVGTSQPHSEMQQLLLSKSELAGCKRKWGGPKFRFSILWGQLRTVCIKNSTFNVPGTAQLGFLLARSHIFQVLKPENCRKKLEEKPRPKDRQEQYSNAASVTFSLLMEKRPRTTEICCFLSTC